MMQRFIHRALFIGYTERSVAAGGREIIGQATLQVTVPDAPLPPPFPSKKPYRQGLTLAHFRAQLEDLRDTLLTVQLNWSTLGHICWFIWVLWETKCAQVERKGAR
jgi:hypothetical protein